MTRRIILSLHEHDLLSFLLLLFRCFERILGKSGYLPHHHPRDVQAAVVVLASDPPRLSQYLYGGRRSSPPTAVAHGATG